MAIKQKLVEKADKSFVDDWRDAWKWLSVQAAVLAGIIVTLSTQYPEEFAKVLEMIPEDLRPFISLIVFSFLPIYLRLRDQSKSTAPPEE